VLALLKIEPEAMQPLVSTPIGWGVCLIVFLMDGLGILWIRKIVAVDV
jgi:Flp pilus assembly protein TadB